MFDKFRLKVKDKVEDKVLDAKMAKDDAVDWYIDIRDFIAAHWKGVLIGLPILFCALWWSLAWIISVDEIVKVTDKETKITGTDPNTGQQVDTYFIYTDKGAFHFHESPFYLQFEVADRFGKIEREKYYKITHYGFRNSYFNWFENIVKIQEIDPETKEVIKTL